MRKMRAHEIQKYVDSLSQKEIGEILLRKLIAESPDEALRLIQESLSR